MSDAPSVVETVGDGQARTGPPDVEQRIGRFTVVERLGSGAMGTVSAADDPKLGRRVAVKVLDHDSSSASTRARLRREAQALAMLSHPNVVQVYEVGEHEGAVYIAMEYVAGVTLRVWMDAERRPWGPVVEAFRAAGRGLAAAHEAGLVHRDFKPDNVIVGADGRVRVLDFGLAFAGEEGTTAKQTDPGQLDRRSGSALRQSDTLGADSLTRTGALLGTPAYLAPERFGGKPANAGTDQFAFCVSLWEALYGQRPFQEDNLAALAAAVVDGRRASPPADRGVPRRVHAVLERGLRVDPSERYPNMTALLADLAPGHRRGWRVAGLGFGLLGLAGIATLWGRSVDRDPCEHAVRSVDDAWSAERSSAMQTAFESSGLPYAGASFERARDALDAYADGLRVGYRSACEAGTRGGEESDRRLDQRMACLHRHRAGLSAAADVLAEADANAVSGAPEIIAALPVTSRCADVEFVGALLPPPADPNRAAQVEKEREGLAEAKATLLAGDVIAGEARIAEIAERARTLDYPPLLAEALWALGNAHAAKDAPETAAKHFEEAFDVAFGAGDDLVARSAAVRLVSLVGLNLRDADRSRHWASMATAAAERVGDASPGWEFELQLSLAQAAIGRGAFDAAAAALDEALRASRAPAGATVHGVFGLRTTFCALEARRGRATPALEHCERAAEIAEELYGPAHIKTAMSLQNLGALHTLRERPQDALPLLLRALAIDEAVHGSSALTLVASLSNIGATYTLLDQDDDAIASYERSLAILEAHGRADTYDALRVLSNLAVVRYGAGDLDEARALHLRALAIAERENGAQHPDAAAQHAHLGKLLAAQEQWAQAFGRFDRAAGIMLAHKANVGYFASFRFEAAKAWWEAEGDPDALAQAQRAYDEREADGADASKLAEIREWLRERG